MATIYKFRIVQNYIVESTLNLFYESSRNVCRARAREQVRVCAAAHSISFKVIVNIYTTYLGIVIYDNSTQYHSQHI